MNWNHPLADGLVHCYLFNEGSGRLVSDLVTGDPDWDLAFVGEPVWHPFTASGWSVSTNGDGLSNYLQTAPGTALPNTGSSIHTYIAGDRPLCGLQENLFGHNVDGPQPFLDDFLYLDNARHFGPVLAGSDYRARVVDPLLESDWVIGQAVQFAGSWQDNLTIAYLNGKERGRASGSWTADLSGGATYGLYALQGRATTRKGAMALALIYDRVLTPDEFLWHSVEPHAFLRARRKARHGVPRSSGPGPFTP